MVLVVRNVLGWMFVLAGIAMLVLPGQGLLSIIAGLVLIDFPGKRRFERRLLASHVVRDAMNWLRRQGRPAALRLYVTLRSRRFEQGGRPTIRAPAIPTRGQLDEQRRERNGTRNAGTGNGSGNGARRRAGRAQMAALLAAVFAVGALGGGAVVMSDRRLEPLGPLGRRRPEGAPRRSPRWKGHMEDHALFWLDRVDATDEQREAVSETIVGQAFDDLAGAVGEHRALRREWLTELERPELDAGALEALRARHRGARGRQEPPGPRGDRRGRVGADRGAARRARLDALMASGPAG